MVSAMDEHDVGCPDLAAVVDSTEWILSLVAMSFRVASSALLKDPAMMSPYFFNRCSSDDGREWQLLGEIKSETRRRILATMDKRLMNETPKGEL